MVKKLIFSFVLLNMLWIQGCSTEQKDSSITTDKMTKIAQIDPLVSRLRKDQDAVLYARTVENMFNDIASNKHKMSNFNTMKFRHKIQNANSIKEMKKAFAAGGLKNTDEYVNKRVNALIFLGRMLSKYPELKTMSRKDFGRVMSQINSKKRLINATELRNARINIKRAN